MKTLDRNLAIVTGVCAIIFWVLYSLATKSVFPGALYYVVWIGLFGGLLWRYRTVIEARLKQWNLHPFLKFALLGYGAVLTEEVLAAFTNNLTEGFSLALYVLRIGQFWAFNILAFTGFIIGWYLLTTRFRYSKREIFYLAGVWGLYAEHFYLTFFSQPLGVALLTLPTMFAYGVVITPAVLSVEKMGARTLNKWLKYALTFAIIFLCSVIPTLILLYLRSTYPGVFPPTTFIQ